MLRAVLTAAAIWIAGPAFAGPAAKLVGLDDSLTKAQENMRQGLIDERRYREFTASFRTDLSSALASVEPIPDNIALHARILARLGDSGAALAALTPALERSPDSAALRLALSQVQYDRRDFPAALAEANAVLERDPANEEALALKKFSLGRVSPAGAVAAPEQFRVPLPKDSPAVRAIVPKIRDARQSGDMPAAMTLTQELMRTEPASEYAQEIHRIVSKDHAQWQRVQVATGYLDSAKAALKAGRGDEAMAWASKAVQTYPAPEVLEFAEKVRSIVGGGQAVPPRPSTPAPQGGGMPLWPLTPAFGLGAAAYAVSRSRRTVVSEDGFNEEDRPEPGELQRLVAGSILAGIAGAAVYLGGAYVVGAGAPIVSRYTAGAGQQAMRLARSEAGAINPRSATEAKHMGPQAKAVSEGASEIVREVVIKKGEYLNRVWDSKWEEGSAVSGPRGRSFCFGACLPINAASSIQRRGLANIPGVKNDARRGAVFRVTEDIVVVVRKSIGGADQEVLVNRADLGKLQQIATSVIPPGTK